MSNAYTFSEKELVQASTAATFERYHTVGSTSDESVSKRTTIGQFMSGLNLDLTYIWEGSVGEDFPDLLRKSLVKVLDLFPVLVGRIDNRNGWVQCNNAGAGFVVRHHSGSAKNVPVVPNRFDYQYFPPPQQVSNGIQFFRFKFYVFDVLRLFASPLLLVFIW